MKLSEEFTFGKYKGKLLKDVIENDYNYVKWARSKDIIFLDATAHCFADKKEQEIERIQKDQKVIFGRSSDPYASSYSEYNEVGGRAEDFFGL